MFIARLLPVIRTFIALPAGVARMPRGKFHIYTFLGSWPWCFMLAYFGMKLGENWRSLGKYFHKFDAVIGAFLLVGIVVVPVVALAEPVAHSGVAECVYSAKLLRRSLPTEKITGENHRNKH